MRAKEAARGIAESRPSYGEERRSSVRYEVHRDSMTTRGGIKHPPFVEVYLGLDRARLSALAYALDGATYSAERFSGVVRIYQCFYRGELEIKRTLVDLLDERVAARVLNEIRLPRADQLAIDMNSFQADLDELVVRP